MFGRDMKSKEPGKTRPVIILAVVVFLDLFAVGMIIPQMPRLIKQMNMSKSSYGMMQSLYGVTQLMGSSVMGGLSDAKGKRFVLQVNCVGAFFSYSVMGFSVIFMSFYMLCASRLLVGLVKQTMTIATACAGTLSSSADRVATLGYLNAAMYCGLIFGPIAGGVLEKHAGGTAVPIFTATIFFLLDFALLQHPNFTAIDAIAETEVPESKERPKSQSIWERIVTLTGLMRNGWSCSLLIVAVVLSFNGTMMHTAYSLMITDRFQLEPNQVGYLMSFHSALAVLMYSVGVPTVNRFLSEPTAITLGSFVGAGWYYAEYSTDSLYFFLFCTIWTSLSSSLLKTCFSAVVTKSFPQSEMGTVLGVIGTLESATRVVAPLLSGVLMDKDPRSPCFWTGVIYFFLGVFSFMRITDASFNQHKEEPVMVLNGHSAGSNGGESSGLDEQAKKKKKKKQQQKKVEGSKKAN